MSKEAMTRALEVLECAKGYVGCESWSPSMLHDVEEAFKAIKEALASEQEQSEPVAWVNLDDLYDLEAGEDGDVPYVVRGNEQPKNMPKSIPLYTTPQPAQKPLTRDDLWKLWCKAKAESEYLFWLEFARAIEAAHGIKENT